MANPPRFVPTAALPVATTAPGAVGNQGSSRGSPPFTLGAQGSFFVGGRDVQSGTLSTNPAFAESGTITVDQVRS